MTRYVAFIIALIALSLPVAAQADYRTGNSWMVTRTGAESAVKFYENWPNTDGHRAHLSWVWCEPDRSGDYPINRARGFFHHLRCYGTLRNTGRYVFFDFWQTGRQDGQFRISNVSYQTA